MGVEVWIVGQGVAGTMLAGACARAGISFRIFDRGHERAASRVGAGLVTPLTGKRLAPTWRMEAWRERALAVYRRWEDELGCRLVREVRVERRWASGAQRDLWLGRLERADARRWVEDITDAAVILRGALQIDTGGLIAAARARWVASGQLVEADFDAAEVPEGQRVVWCTGAVAPPGMAVPWQPSRGEVCRGRLAGLAADLVLNDGHWLLPPVQAEGVALVGSTFDRDALAAGVTGAGQNELRAAARRLAGCELGDAVGDWGLRVTVPDRRPVVGWGNAAGTRGVLAGLAAKGALWAPVLAEQWVDDGLGGAGIEPEARVGRFGVG